MFILEHAYDERPDIKSELEDIHLYIFSLFGYSAPAVKESLLSRSHVHGRTALWCARDQCGA